MIIKISGRLVLAVVLVWLLVAAADVASLYLGDAASAMSDWGWVWYKRLVLVPYWVAVSVLALRWFSANPLVRRRLVQQSVVIALGILGISFGFVCCLSAAITAFVGESWTSLVFGEGLAASLLYGASRAVAILLAASAYCYYRRMNAREHERRELQLRLARAELLLFRSQLEPHFLFNTLNSIAALIRLERYETAIEAVYQLSKLLRHVLEAGAQQQVPFGWEAGFTQLYIDLQRLRFGDKLQVRFSPEKVPRSIPVPIMLLQPLIENAINHGPLADAKPCEVFIDVNHRRERLRIEVRNAIGRSSSRRDGGVGLKNIEGRLRALYGEDFEFASVRADGTFTLRLEFPATETAVPEAAVA